ncbi:peptidoglycan O-acetyltransferase [Andreesenia angusta]|uniref:Peptidoglycan O-acetyltransferase n=1 Tax=Andreesenia angusta TaxID=39480 RepID=A0A1S1V5Z8_9FIRM|nr:MBOAT family protein [Andreesenia angusta]OHW61820.1 peptidoglycan O-acetyltransferase [Andreesenia angusta]
MLFSSLIFLFVFLPSVLVLYYALGKKFRNIVLLGFSLFFYAYGGPKYLLVMLFSIAMNYVFGLMVERFREDHMSAKRVLTFSGIGNLTIIGYYKYTDFFIQNINTVFRAELPYAEIVMPIGISFFTFQGMSYVIDIYRGHGKVQKNPLNVALYISLFPQLIAGPIVRYETVADQIEGRVENFDKFVSGISRFIVGLSKKVLLANSMGLIADEVFANQPADISVLLSWIGAIAYTGQIYFDFSGYSDMAIGLGRMFGFEFLENFNYPYISKSVTEFWRRWHISLSTWFRDYVYIPLGGNKVSKVKHLRNIFAVWMLTGLWHGASWNFVSWGLYFGVILVVEKFFIGERIGKLWAPLRHIYTMTLVVVGWIMFRSETLGYAGEYLAVMFGASHQELLSDQAMYYLTEYRMEFLLAIVASTPIYRSIKEKLSTFQTGSWVERVEAFASPIVLSSMFLLCIMNLVNSTFNPFIYFRF